MYVPPLMIIRLLVNVAHELVSSVEAPLNDTVTPLIVARLPSWTVAPPVTLSSPKLLTFIEVSAGTSISLPAPPATTST